jgi:hypothetical protein
VKTTAVREVCRLSGGQTAEKPVILSRETLNQALQRQFSKCSLHFEKILPNCSLYKTNNLQCAAFLY